VGGCEERREGGRTASRSGTSGAPGRCRTSCAPQARGVPGPDEDCRSKNGDNSRGGGGGGGGGEGGGVWGAMWGKGGGGGAEANFVLSFFSLSSFFLSLPCWKRASYCWTRGIRFSPMDVRGPARVEMVVFSVGIGRGGRRDWTANPDIICYNCGSTGHYESPCWRARVSPEIRAENIQWINANRTHNRTPPDNGC